MPNRFSHQRYSLLNVDQVNLNARWKYSGIISPYCRIYYISSGEGQLSDTYGISILESGYLYLIPSFTMCDMSCPRELTQFYVQFFEESGNGISIFEHLKQIIKIPASELDIQLFTRLLKINPNRGINRSDDPKKYENDRFYQDCQLSNLQQNPAVYYETQGILQQLCSRFLNSIPRYVPRNNPHSHKMAMIVNHIVSNLGQNLCISELAEKVNLHPDYFSRQFKEQTGIRPNNFINQKRIERAQYLLATTALNYTEIADATGFDNLSYFSKTFKKITGLSPRDYKKQVYNTNIGL
ncbi:AraC family transcriptional regulator [Pedobacter sp. MC2016-05]|uniref:helix-turn-helix domain-containing protein n=1 Tax=Pedobacter sp. MC2016-05 TaxID=2994474 RepID=UPI002248376E|nr:AraC family transcriptional regulator [Pedobacter sp. MC2016-05]MCX2475314.1 AraC family transcriptional regulator [Pedobacter sp. MC2016-05]